MHNNICKSLISRGAPTLLLKAWKPFPHTIVKSIKIKFNESMALHTSFKIGGPCNAFVIPRTEDEIKTIIQYTTQHNLPLITIGNGTNLLFPDDKFAGVVMRIAEPYFSDVRAYCNTPLQGDAGISISKLLKITTEQGLSGLEFMSGIPGTLGGAIVMNAGAYGRRIGERVKRVRVINRDSNAYWIKNKEAEFGYRESRFKTSGEIILEAELDLNKEDPNKVKARIQEILSERETKFPLEFPSAGCVFKNPSTIPAAKLIELTGCKGLKIGSAQVSDKHANFIVNLGNATYKDVKTLITEVQKRVYERFKISLDLELIIL